MPGGVSPFKLHTWLLGSADEGNMVVTAPASAVTGEVGTIGLSFSGLAPDTRYLGSVAYGRASHSGPGPRSLTLATGASLMARAPQ
jgi:hypothetical protein